MDAYAGKVDSNVPVEPYRAYPFYPDELRRGEEHIFLPYFKDLLILHINQSVLSDQLKSYTIVLPLSTILLTIQLRLTSQQTVLF